MTSATTFSQSRSNNSVPRQLGAIGNALHSPAHVILPNLQTPFSQYCDMNYAASDSESRQIHHIIADQIAQLVDVENEIERVENLMAQLRGFHLQLTDSRNKIQQTINRHQGLISCIRRFPAETLGEIFIHCLPPDPHIQPNPRQAPLLLTRICRSWRQVALATPRLWCSLYVGPSHRVQQQALSFYHTWLSRARSVPLSIAVDTRLVHAPFNPMWRFEVTELLKRYTSRCSCLYVMFDEEASLHAMLRDVPTLEHLTLAGDMQKVRTLSFGQPDSRLRSLSITTSPFGAESLSSFNLGWTHLTELKVVLSNGTHLDGHVYLRILQLCPNLVQLTFIAVSVTRNEVADMGIADHLLHARLQVMDIVVLYGIGILLDALTLPQLRTLGISHLIPGSQFWPHTQFKTLLSRSQCPLGSLTVKGAKITPGHHAEYVQVAPSLKNLHSGIGY